MTPPKTATLVIGKNLERVSLLQEWMSDAGANVMACYDLNLGLEWMMQQDGFFSKVVLDLQSLRAKELDPFAQAFEAEFSDLEISVLGRVQEDGHHSAITGAMLARASEITLNAERSHHLSEINQMRHLA